MPSNQTKSVLSQAEFETPLGLMTAIADEQALWLLEFSDRIASKKIKFLDQSMESGEPDPIKSVKAELQAYFNHQLSTFKTPLRLHGTVFQKRVWQVLQTIPFGETISYAELAQRIQQPSAFRAAANANGRNVFPILIPCHRVINTGGALGGYSSGLERKRWLLDHERVQRRTS